jgi:hypothetical protein
MSLNIRNITDPGNDERERVVFDVTADIDVGKYLVLKTTRVDTKISSKATDVYWFPDKKVKKGDVVVLYTKSGIDSSTLSEKDGNTSYFFYWRKPSPIFGSENDAVVLVSSDRWEYKFKS